MTAQKDRGNIKMQNTQRRIVLAALLQAARYTSWPRESANYGKRAGRS